MTDVGGELAQKAVGDGVERAAHDAPSAAGMRGSVLGKELGDAAHHLGGGLVGESQEQDFLGSDAAGDEVGDAEGNHAGLARTGARQNQARPIGGGDSGVLLGIELVFEVERRGREGFGAVHTCVTLPCREAGSKRTESSKRPAEASSSSKPGLTL